MAPVAYEEQKVDAKFKPRKDLKVETNPVFKPITEKVKEENKEDKPKDEI